MKTGSWYTFSDESGEEDYDVDRKGTHCNIKKVVDSDVSDDDGKEK